MMAWLITAKIIVVFLVLALLVPELQAAYHTATYTGTCASIGYSTKCCPPGLDCTAKDGNCTCDTSCHNHKNLCCKDVFCRQKPRSCQDIGCCDTDTSCSEMGSYIYSINGSAIKTNCSMSSQDCPKNCTEAHFNPGNCKWHFEPRNKMTCLVNYGNCYCDPACMCFGDCCEDVKEEDITSKFDSTEMELQCITVYAILHILEQPSCSHGEVQTDDGEEPYRQYRLAINARLQNMREKAIIREFGHP